MPVFTTDFVMDRLANVIRAGKPEIALVSIVKTLVTVDLTVHV